MTSQDAIQQNIQNINRLQSDLSSLQGQVRLSAVRDAVEDIETTISGFPQRVQALRSRQYAFEKDLEAQARNFAVRWAPLKVQVRSEITRQAQALEKALEPAETRMTRLAALKNSPGAAGALIRQMESELTTIQSKASAADSALRGMFDGLQTEVNTMHAGLSTIEQMLDHLESASFGLMPNEAGILAVKATFIEGKEDKDDPQGILFLTDQRLIFERKQEVATKKVLFIATEKQLVQEVIMDAALGMLEEVIPSKRGLFKNEDHLDLTFGPSAPLREAHLHLFGQDCGAWKTAIQRARSGEYDLDRAIAIDADAVEEVKNAPTICPGCGAALQQKVLRGMDAITCIYCGTVIRI